MAGPQRTEFGGEARMSLGRQRPILSRLMCGRFTQQYTWQELHEFLRLIGPALNLRPRYNVAPSQNVAVVRSGGAGHRLSMCRWGLIPAGATDPNIGHKLINARAEAVSVKPSFRAAYRDRRCLVPAGGFYEWKRRGGQTTLFHRGLYTVVPKAAGASCQSSPAHDAARHPA